MPASGRTEALAARHADLERQIAAEMQRPMPDTTRLTELKKTKLRVKEEIEALGASEHSAH